MSENETVQFMNFLYLGKFYGLQHLAHRLERLDDAHLLRTVIEHL
jgi:hypothetical protein